MTKRIPLTKGKYALVDNEDYLVLSQYKWHISTLGYATRYAGGGRKNRKREWMHRAINQTPEGYITDHINGDKLDNRKSNLRTVNKSQNTLNSPVRSDNKSGHRGISWDASRNKWSVDLSFNGKRYRLGRFSSLDEAIKARRETSLIAKEYLYAS